MNSWRLIPYRKFSAFENMAIDEAVFRGNQEGTSPPTLRFYGWQPPALSLGYFQNAEQEVNLSYCRENNIDIVRRPTGGKAVFHDRELTYSLTSREDNSPFSPGVLKIYLLISRCILDGLARLGICAEMTEQGRLSPDGGATAHCFSSPSRYELLVEGKKICGSAQTRINGAFLQHGSLLLNFDADKALSVISNRRACEEEASLMEAVTFLQAHLGGDEIDPERLSRVLRAGFEDVLRVKFFEGWLTPAEEALKNRLQRDKYQNDLWNRSGKAFRNHD